MTPFGIGQSSVIFTCDEESEPKIMGPGRYNYNFVKQIKSRQRSQCDWKVGAELEFGSKELRTQDIEVRSEEG